MKTYFICLTFIGLLHASNAQTINIPTTLNVSEGLMELDKVERNGFSIPMEGEEKEIIKAFEDFLEDRSKKYKVTSFFKKVSGEDLLVPEFSDKHFSLNAQVREAGASTTLWYWISFGTDVYVNSAEYPSESDKCNALLKDFARSYFSSFVNDNIDSVTETMEKSQDELDDAVDDLGDLTKKQQKEKKSKEKLEKKKLKLESKLAALQASISDKDTDIQKTDSDLELLTKEISEKEDSKKGIEKEISAQQKTLKELRTKLAAIQQL